MAAKKSAPGIKGELRKIFGPPPAKRAKRLPKGIVCSCCGGPLRSLQGYWLKRNEYAVECRGLCCVYCHHCDDKHPKSWDCGDPAPELNREPRYVMRLRNYAEQDVLEDLTGTENDDLDLLFRGP